MLDINNKDRIYVDYTELEDYEKFQEKLDNTNAPIFIKQNGVVKSVAMNMNYYNNIMITLGEKTITKEGIDAALRKEKDKLGTDEAKINEVRNMIRDSISEVSYNTWIAPDVTKMYVEDTNLIAVASNSFSMDILEKRYKKLLINSCKAVNLDVNKIEFKVSKEK